MAVSSSGEFNPSPKKAELSAWEYLEQFKQFYSRCFAAAESAGLRQQLG
jgi:hypothetical protein